MIRLLYILLVALLVVGLVAEAVVGDGWRVAGFSFVLVCLLAVRDDLTRTDG